MSDITLAGTVLSLADIPAAVETALAEEPAWAESLSSNPYLKPATWERVLDLRPKVKVVANLVDRSLDEEQIDDLVEAKEVRYRALATLERTNGISVEHASALARRRMPSGSAVLLASIPGMSRDDVDVLVTRMSPRAALAYFADCPVARVASYSSAWSAIENRFGLRGDRSSAVRAAVARVLWHRPALRAKALRPDAPEGILPVIASYALDTDQRAIVRARAVEIASTDWALAADTLANLFVAGRLGNSGDTRLDAQAADAVGIADAVAARIADSGFKRPTPDAPIVAFSREGRLPARSLPAALHLAYRALNCTSRSEAQRLASRLNAPIFVDQLGLAVARSAARSLSMKSGLRVSITQVSTKERRARYRKNSEIVLDDVANQPTHLVLEAVQRNADGEVAMDIAAYVSENLGDNLAAWQMCLRMLDETQTAPADAVFASLQLAG